MAVQYHVAYSGEVSGAAIFAGGPFYCALSNLGVATTSCMLEPLLIDTDVLVDAAKAFAKAGDIDEVEGLRGDKVRRSGLVVALTSRRQVYVYSGTLDTVVHPGVVKKTAEFYGLVQANVTTDYTVPSEHCQPTIDFGNDCSKLATPYLSKCDFDGAGAALEVLLAPKALKPRGQYNPNNLQHVKVRRGRLSCSASDQSDCSNASTFRWALRPEWPTTDTRTSRLPAASTARPRARFT
jgi:hypothetical protein